MKIKNISSIIFVLFIITITIWYLFFKNPKDPVITIDYQYETDTVYADTIFIPGKPYPVPTPPKTVIIYRIDSISLDSLKLILNEKDIVILGLRDSISIHINYLKQFPKNPKLLAIDLKRDTIRLGLLQISGQVQEQNWPIDLNQFNYRWNIAADLSRHPTKPSPTLKKPFANYFVGGGVDLLYTSPYLSGKIEKDLARIRLYGNIDLGLLNNKTNGIKLGVDYKLWQNQQ